MGTLEFLLPTDTDFPLASIQYRGGAIVTDTRIVCASHSPLMYCAASEPSSEAEICAAFAARAAEVAAFKPDVIFAFGPDHYTSMFHSMAPVFCIGTRCEAIGDIGGFAGRLDVPTELATECIASVYAAGVDVAVSHDLKIDHGISDRKSVV